jgi:uncharacterized protein
MKIALIDAGPLIALFDASEPAHRHYEGLLADSASAYRLYTTWPCVVEASHLLDSVARLEMLKWVALGGVQVFPFQADDLLPMTQWMQAYTQPPRSEMDFADASLYWLAHESGVTAVLTLDIKDFSRYRLPDGRAFEIV